MLRVERESVCVCVCVYVCVFVCCVCGRDGGVPMTAGKTSLGASSPANPALTRPVPLSMTIAVSYSTSEE